MRCTILLCLCGLFFGCNKYTIEKLPEERLHFGNAGGFTGEIREYILLLDNGRILFNNRETGQLEKIGKLKKEGLAATRTELAAIDFSTAQNKPGNMNTLLEYHVNGGVKSMQWSGPKNAPDQAAGACFQQLMASVRALREAQQAKEKLNE